MHYRIMEYYTMYAVGRSCNTGNGYLKKKKKKKKKTPNTTRGNVGCHK